MHAIEVQGIKKHFGGVHAIKNIDLTLNKGEIHAIVGENGAGKSTLMKILSGAYIKDSGTIKIFGKEYAIGNPKASKKLGIGIVYQEFSLVPDLTIAENIFLDRISNHFGFVDHKNLQKKTKNIIKQFGFDIEPQKKVEDLSVGWQQIIEITKVLSQDIKILILDEPTAVLSPAEIKILFQILKKLKSQDVSILYISHRLEEIFEIADRLTVVKDGESIVTKAISEVTESQVVEYMIGRSMESLFPKRVFKKGKEILRVEKLSNTPLFSDISFSLKEGEILGLAGLIGAGRTEVARVIFGVDKKTDGHIYIHGKKVNIRNPYQAISHGVGLVPEDRKAQGAILSMAIAENTTLPRLFDICHMGFINFVKENHIMNKFKKKLAIRMGANYLPVSSLSGGNQQKVILAKWLFAAPKILILDEPTRGVDIGAKAEIYEIITKLSMAGYALILISSELIELMGLCDRVIILSEGRQKGELSKDNLSEKTIMEFAIPSRSQE